MLNEQTPTCDYCAEKFWAQLIPKYGNPPCHYCKMPELEAGNYVAWLVFQLCASQIRVVGMGTPMGIEFAAIEMAIENLKVHSLDRDMVFRRVAKLGEAYAKMLNERDLASRKARGEKIPMAPGMTPPPMYEKAALDKLKHEERAVVFDPFSV